MHGEEGRLRPEWQEKEGGQKIRHEVKLKAP
jgi:hypothetical protein